MNVLATGPLQQVVILEVPTTRFQTRITTVGRVAVAVAKQVVLEFRGGLDRPIRRRGDLRPEQRAGGKRDEVAGRVVDGVTEHDGGAIQPGDLAQRRQVGHQVNVAVTLFPVRERVTGDGFHFHVSRQQVVATVRTVFGDLLEKKTGIDAFADQSAIEIGDTDDDRIDRLFADQRREFLEGQATGGSVHGGESIGARVSGGVVSCWSRESSRCAADSRATSSSGACATR